MFKYNSINTAYCYIARSMIVINSNLCYEIVSNIQHKPQPYQLLFQ